MTGAFAASIALLEGMQHLSQFHEKWISYRSVAEALETERALFSARVQNYKGSDAESVLATNVERILTKEHGRWSSTEESTLAHEPTETDGTEGVAPGVNPDAAETAAAVEPAAS